MDHIGAQHDPTWRRERLFGRDPRPLLVGLRGWGIGLLDTRKEGKMPTYVVLAHFTDQGIRNIKESPKREDPFRELCEKMGAPTVRPVPEVGMVSEKSADGAAVPCVKRPRREQTGFSGSAGRARW